MLSYLVLSVLVTYASTANTTTTTPTTTTPTTTTTTPKPTPAPCSSPMIWPNSTGDIASPSYPQPYPSNLTCKWILSAGKPVYIWIKDFELSVGDSLCVYNGSGTLIHNFTGKQDFGVVYSAAVNTTVVFRGRNDSSTPSGRRYQLHYTTKECVVDTSRSNGILPGPYYVQSPGFVKCIYQVKDNNPDTVMDLTFADFDLEKAQVSIIEGNKTLKTFTKSNPDPDDMILKAGNLSVSMQLAGSLVENFTVIFRQVNQDCSKEETISKQTTLTSPGYPGNYGNNMDCRWIFHSPEGTTLSLQFTALMMADTNDRVIVKDGGSRLSPDLGIFTMGSNVSDTYYQTSTNVTWIQFTMDQLLRARGFNLTITPQAYGQRFINTGFFSLGIHPNDTNSSKPNITSPGGDVSYQFHAEPGNQVYVVFGKDAVMFPNSVIKCYDGLSVTDPLIGHLTSPTAFRPVFSNGNQMLILVTGFLSNSTMTRQYLAGSFKAVKNDGTLYNSLDVAGGWSLSMAEDTFPGHATWLIHNHLSQELVSLKLGLVDTGTNSTLSVYRGLSDQDLRIVNITNMTTTDLPEIYISKDNEGCRVVYETRHPTPNHTQSDNIGWTVLRATYTLKPDCNANITSQRGSWFTPGFPNLYPYNANCTSTLSVPKNKMLHLTFTSFDLAQFHDLTLLARSYHDYNVTVGNKTHHYRNVTERSLGHFGGQVIPNDLVTSVNDTEIVVKFSSSGGFAVATGINMTYEIIDCGGNMTGVNGSFVASLSHNETMRNTSTCVWIITLPNITRHDDSVNIVSFSYSMTGGNISSLDLRDGLSASAESIPVNATGTANNPIMSRTNALWVKYTFQAGPKGAVNKAGFQLNYTTYECPKSQQCNNSICMQKAWRCNGRDDCGDGSDEDGCTYPHNDVHQGYAGWALAVAIIMTFVIAVFATFAAQAIYKRCRYQNYDELRDLMAPVPT